MQYLEIDASRPLRQQLAGKVVVEYPTLLVLLPRERGDYTILPAATAVAPVAAAAAEAVPAGPAAAAAKGETAAAAAIAGEMAVVEEGLAAGRVAAATVEAATVGQEAGIDVAAAAAVGEEQPEAATRDLALHCTAAAEAAVANSLEERGNVLPT